MFSEKEREKLLKNIGTRKYKNTEITKPLYEKVKNQDDITKMQYIDINLWLIGDILLKADKMSMANSLEVRVPFLDKEVAKIATQLPLEYKVNKDNTKYALRLAAKRKLKDNVANRKKLGFPVPIRLWLKEEKYYNIVKDYFTSTSAKQYFNVSELTNLLDEHYKGNKDNSRKIWTIFIFLIWYEQFFTKEEHNTKRDTLMKDSTLPLAT